MLREYLATGAEWPDCFFRLAFQHRKWRMAPPIFSWVQIADALAWRTNGSETCKREANVAMGKSCRASQLTLAARTLRRIR
jgi:hypothetical protein